MTVDFAIFPKNIERRVTEVFPQPNNGTPLFYSAADSTISAGTIADTTDQNGVRCSMATDGTNGFVAGVKGELIYTRNMKVNAHFRFKLQQTSSLRFFIGLTSAVDTRMVTGDSPTADYIGVHFSTVRGDTNFMFIHNDGGIMPSAISSGVAADIGLHDLYIWTQGSAVIIQLDDTRAVFITDLPNISTKMRYDIEIRAEAAIVKKFESGKIRVDQDY